MVSLVYRDGSLIQNLLTSICGLVPRHGFACVQTEAGSAMNCARVEGLGVSLSDALRLGASAPCHVAFFVGMWETRREIKITF